MPSKAEFYRQMADHVATQLTGSWQEWAGFLTTAARLYKYPFHEQMMIYAQRPDATACAEYDLWNEKMKRYVRYGSKGIALVDDSGDRLRLRYVFDISDTGTREHSRTPWLWTLREEHIAPVMAMLERNYHVGGEELAQQLSDVAADLAEEYWADHKQDIFYIVDGSFLEDYDELNIEVQFKAAATVSIAYALMSRCGLEPEHYFTHEDFMAIFDFNTPAAIGALGTAVSQMNQQVLRQIGVTILNYEREAMQERRNQHEESHDLHPERGLSDSQPATERTAVEAPGQVRQDAENIPEGTPAHPLQSAIDEREAVPASVGDRRNRPETHGADDAGTDKTGGSDRGAESQRPNEVGGTDEHLQGAGRGDFDGGTYQQLTLNLFPSEAEQIQNIDEAENVRASSAFSFAQTEIDHVLRLGGNTDRQRERIAAAFEEQKSIPEIADYLKTLYHGGNGVNSVAAWYDENGIRLFHGYSARHDKSAQVISWETAAERIGQLLEEGQFATNVELAEAEGYERSRLAEKLWHLYHDVSEEARESGYLPSLSKIQGNGFPEETSWLAGQLKSPEFRQTLAEEYAAFWTAYDQDRGLLRFHYHRSKEIWERLKDLSLPRIAFSSQMTEVPAAKQFITEDEIDAALTGGSGVEGGKGRIFTFFRESHTDKEKVDFLKREYGIGGRSHALAAGNSWEDHDGKGIRYRKDGCPNVSLTWEKVSKRIAGLIQKGRYLTEQEQAAYDKIQAEKALAEAEQTVNDQELLRPLSQSDIDDAIRAWNGDISSKHAVVRYMKNHAREKDTAVWLAREFDGGDGNHPFTVRSGSSEGTELPWPKVQRRLVQLIQREQFYTHAEQENLNDADSIAVRETLEEHSEEPEQAGAEEEEPRFSVIMTSDAFPDPEDAYAVWDQVIDNYYADDDGTVRTFRDETAAEEFLHKLLAEHSAVKQEMMEEQSESAIEETAVLPDAAYEISQRLPIRWAIRSIWKIRRIRLRKFGTMRFSCFPRV